MYALECASLGVKELILPDSAGSAQSKVNWHDLDSAYLWSGSKERFDVVFACDVLADAGVVGMSFVASVRSVARIVKMLLMGPEGRFEGLPAQHQSQQSRFILAVPAESPF